MDHQLNYTDSSDQIAGIWNRSSCHFVHHLSHSEWPAV